MTPLCIGVNCENPCKPRERVRPSLLGPRFIDGVHWCWFCSKACAGRAQGLRASKDNRVAVYARKVLEARQRARIATLHATWDEDVKCLAAYGVPRHLSLAILDRVYGIGFKAGYTRAFNRHGRKAA